MVYALLKDSLIGLDQASLSEYPDPEYPSEQAL